jgi:hypothetical protein
MRRTLCLCVCVAFLFFVSITLWPRVTSAHEPITTKVRFNKEVVRILQRSCLGCHRPGGIAMSLATYEEARPWAKAIKEEMLEKRMPPWRAVKGFGEFRNTPPLAQREIDLIVNWIEGGAPKGDDKDLPAGPLYSDEWQLGQPDLVLKPQTETPVAADADETRTLRLATNLKEDRWLTAIDLRPGNGVVVHCAKFYLSDEKDSEGMKPTKAPTAESSAFIPHPSSLLIGTWMPGQKIVALPDGIARLLAAGARITVKIHYHGAGEETKDASEVGLYFAKTPPRKTLQEIAVTNPDAVIPAGAAMHQVTASFTIQDDTEAIAIRPGVNPLLLSLQATAYRPDGSEEVMIWARGYGFDWQPTYVFKRAVALPKGTRIETIAYFDNTDSNRNNPNDPAKAVRWPDLTADPLCALIIAKPRSAND